MTVTSVERCRKARGRVNVFVDGEYSFSCYAQTALDEDVRPGRVLSCAELEHIKTVDGDEFAWKAACRYISTGMRTEQQVRTCLTRRGLDTACIDRTVSRLTEYGLLDDREYAEMLAQELYRKYGRWVVRRKLRERGIDEETAEAVTAVPCDYDVLKRLAESSWLKAKGLPSALQKQKTARFLAAKGFDYEDIRRAVEECAAHGTGREDDS